MTLVDWSELRHRASGREEPTPRSEPQRPGASAPDQLIGLQLHPFFDGETPETTERELDLVRESGSNAVRIDLSWSSLQIEAPDRYDEDYAARVDSVIEAARERGLYVIVTFLSTPCWASSAPESDKQGCTGRWWKRGVTAYPPVDPATYGEAAAYVARRWGGDIAALEIWNEPNYELFLRTDEPAREYGELLRAAYRRVKAERPELPVLGASFALADGEFLEELYDEGRIAGSYDAIAWHPYSHPYSPRAGASRAGVESSFRDGAAELRRIMREHGDERAELWATEAGSTTCREGVDERCVDEETQARWIREYVELAPTVPGLRALIIYNLRDKGTDPEDVEAGFGLVRRDFRPKPAFESFSRALARR